MRRYSAYAWYVFRHKWYVMVGCRRARVSLWRGLVHDLSKFSPAEFGPYARNFFNADGTRRQVRDATGAYDPAVQPAEFQLAWLHHQKNPHHWQAWTLLGDYGKLEPQPMPEKYVREMVADWIGAGIAIAGRSDPRPWWVANAGSMVLHEASLQMVNRVLGELYE